MSLLKITETLLLQHISSPTCSQSCHEVRGGGRRTAGEDCVEPSYPFMLLCRKLELPLVSGPVEGKSFHLPESELFLMWPPPTPHTSRAVLSSSLFFIPTFLSPPFSSPENRRVVMPTCLWQQQAEVVALTTSGPRPSGRMEQHTAPGHSCGPSFSLLSLKCIHSVCLGPRPW